MKQPYQLGLSISIALLLAACGGGDSGTGSSASSNGTSTADKPALKQATSNTELESLIKQQMLETYGIVRPKLYGCDTDCLIGVAPASFFVNGSRSTSVSATNTQETNVDEADLIKTDGTYLYTISTTPPGELNTLTDQIVTNTTNTAAAISVPIPVTKPTPIRIFKTNQASSALVKEMVVDNDSSMTPTGLYLDGSKLAVLAEDNWHFGWNLWSVPSYWQNQRNQIHLLNVTNPENPTQIAKLALDGQVVSSRRIGSTLYLATRHSPSLPGLNQYPTTETEASANRNLINTATLNDFLPDYQLNDGSKTEIFSADDCLITQYTNKKSHQTSIISLLAIDMNNPTPTPQGKCFAGDTETLYTSTDAIYLATTQYNYQPVDNIGDPPMIKPPIVYDPNISTDLHKFSLASGIQYRGSGRVEGHLGWQQDLKSFRMSEHNGVLRLLTYTGDNNPSINPSPARLYTLQENATNQSLEILGKLPNNNRPAALGKGGEQIYATRFIGSKGYLMTFRITDPLYILDLSNPADPFIVNELKIDGYSDYIHPVGENYLLGIGKDAIPDADATWGDAWYQGVKLTLIDVTNPATPYEKEKIIIGKRGTDTTVSQTHHALTTLQKGNTLQVALPIILHETDSGYSSPSDPRAYYEWTQDELYRLNINTQTGTMQTLAPIVASRAPGAWLNDRSVMIGDFIHYLHGDKVISQAW